MRSLPALTTIVALKWDFCPIEPSIVDPADPLPHPKCSKEENPVFRPQGRLRARVAHCYHPQFAEGRAAEIFPEIAVNGPMEAWSLNTHPSRNLAARSVEAWFLHTFAVQLVGTYSDASPAVPVSKSAHVGDWYAMHSFLPPTGEIDLRQDALDCPEPTGRGLGTRDQIGQSEACISCGLLALVGLVLGRVRKL